jgi:hypothetical protein
VTPERGERSGAVDLGRLERVGRLALRAREHDQGHERRPLPDHDHDHRANGLGRADLGDLSAVRSATQAAILASVVTCTRRGAEPPWAGQLAGYEGWRWLPQITSPAAGQPSQADHV